MKYVYVCTLICTSLTLFSADSLDDFDNPLNSITWQQFFTELWNPTVRERRRNAMLLDKYSQEAGKNLAMRAGEGDITAMFELAKKTDDDQTPPIVPMYWWATIAKMIEVFAQPLTAECRKRKRAAENQLDITFKCFLLTNEKEDEMRRKKPRTTRIKKINDLLNYFSSYKLAYQNGSIL